MIGQFNQSLINSMNLINFLFCLILTGSFPFWIIYELIGLPKLYPITFIALNGFTILTSKIKFKINNYDLFFIFFILYISIYYLIINRLNLNTEISKTFFFQLIKDLIIPYFTGRIISEKLNANFFRSIKYVYFVYLFIFIILFINDPSMLFLKDFRMFDYGKTWVDLNKTHGSFAEVFASTGLGFIFISFFTKLNIKISNYINLSFLKSKILVIFSLLFMIYIAGSRTLLMSLFILTFFSLRNNISSFLRSILKLNYLKIIIPFTIISLIFIFSINNNYLYSKFFKIFSFFDINKDFCLEYKSSIGLRLSFIKESFNIIKNNLIFGVGPGNFLNNHCIDYVDIFSKKQEYALGHPHNLILHIFSELGLLGLILIGIPFLKIIKKCNFIIQNLDSSLINKFIAYSWQFEIIFNTISGSYFGSGIFLSLFTGIITSINLSKKSSFEDTNIDRISKI